jgi:Protein of unknown function (DUF4238)
VKYKGNHYVPVWYQERFLPTAGERKFRYLDLTPDQFRDARGILRAKTALHRWGAVSCFKETDLYTVKYGRYESTEIEQFFFGKVDVDGREAVEFFSRYRSFDDFRGDINPEKVFNSLLNYMSIQKFRTPKGLRYLATIARATDKNRLLIEMQRLQNLHCAIWTECVWALVSADETQTKFILSDHPVTVYNRDVFPDSSYAREHTDPDFRMNGTHTYFPLSPARMLVLTNLSWARNPYGNGQKPRPNPQLFRTAIFKFTDIQTGRQLQENEVKQINYITKRRAHRYVAAAQEDWLYPERDLPTTHWRKLDDRYLFMPDPRELHLGGEIMIGYEDGRSAAFDEYGRRPWQADYKRTDQGNDEERTLYRFKGEFARLFGPKRRGRSESFGGRIKEIDSDAFHQYHLDLEKKYRPTGLRPRRDARAH